MLMHSLINDIFIELINAMNLLPEKHVSQKSYLDMLHDPYIALV